MTFQGIFWRSPKTIAEEAARSPGTTIDPHLMAQAKECGFHIDTLVHLIECFGELAVEQIKLMVRVPPKGN